MVAVARALREPFSGSELVDAPNIALTPATFRLDTLCAFGAVERLGQVIAGPPSRPHVIGWRVVHGVESPPLA